MELRFTYPVMVVLAVAGATILAQRPTPGEKSSIFTSQTTNVLVPALVRDAAGKVVYTLQADDFALTDNGVSQKLTLEHETGNPPLAPTLSSIVGNVYHHVAVVTFDSRPKLIQSFTSDLDEAEETLRDLSA